MIRQRDITTPNDFQDIYNIRFKFNTELIKGKVKYSCDNIMTFDIETSNGMYDPETQRAVKFDKEKYDADFDKPETERAYQKYMEHCKPVSVMYLWQFCCETKLAAPHANDSDLMVFVGRTWPEFENFMDCLTAELKRQSVYGFNAINRANETAIAKKNKRCVECFIFDHNLGFEMVHLCNIYNKEFAKKNKVFAREACNPMKIRISLNKVGINFKDTFVLTQKSLYKWTHDDKLAVMKLEEPEEFYENVYTPITPIESERLQYSINDVVSMAYGMEKYRDTYGSLSAIPLTQTGTVRLPARENLWENDPDWCERCAYIERDYGDNIDLYKKLLKVFAGGWVHSNEGYTGRIVPNVKCYDFCSSYPSQTRFKVPYEPYSQVNILRWDELTAQDVEDPDYRWFAKIEVKNVESNLMNSYWSFSKCEECDNPTIDNGRINKCDRMVIWIDDWSWAIFKEAYSFTEITVMELWRSKAEYMSKTLILHILDLFHKKNAWKGLEEFESQLMFVKQQLNAIAYGCAVFKELGAEVTYTEHGWVVDRDQSELDFYKKMEGKKPEKTFWALQDGISIVSAARYCLWKLLLKLDAHVVYGDTDSLKGLFNNPRDQKIIEEYNKSVEDQQIKVANALGFNPDEWLGVNAKGKAKRLGVFEEEPPCKIITWGAKKYAEELEDGTIVVTVSGLPKKAGRDKIKSLEDFKLETLWRTSESHKLTSHYNWGDQPVTIWTDINGEEYVSEDKFGLCLVPTTFSMNISEDYMEFLYVMITQRMDNHEFFYDTPKILL